MNKENLFIKFPIGIVYQNAKGEITDANKSAQEILGLSIEQMQGRKSIDPRWKSIKEDGSDFPGNEHPAIIALNTRRVIQDVIMGVFHPKKNDIVWINIHATPEFKNGEKKPFQVFTTFTDITTKMHDRANLISSEKKYRKLIKEIHVPMMIITHGTIKFVNDELVKISGFSIDEMLERDFVQFIYPDDRQLVYANYKNRIEGKEVENIYRTRAIRKNGEAIWVEVEVSTTTFNEQESFIVTMHDVHEEVKVKEVLHRNAAELSMIMNTTSDMIYAVDHDYNLIFANQKFIETTVSAGGKPIKPGESIMSNEYTEEFLRMWKEYFNRALRGESFTVETSLLSKDGKVHYLENVLAPGKNEKGEVYCAIVSSNDITLKKKEQIMLMESQSRYKTLFEKSGAAIVVMDKDGNYLHINKLAADNLGGHPSDFLGKNIMDILDEKTAKEFLVRNKEIIEVGLGSTYERSFDFTDGQKTFVITDEVVKDMEGKGIALQSSSIEITELRILQNQFKNILKNTSEIIFAIDRDYCLLFANNSFSESIKQSGGKEIKVGESVLNDDYPSDFLDFWKKNYARAFNGEVFDVESSLGWDDGTHILNNSISPIINDNGNVTGAVIITNDVTKLRQANKNLENKEHEIQSIINRANVGTWIWNVQNGKTTFSETWANILGYTLEEISPTSIETWNSFVHPEDLKNSYTLIQEHFDGKTKLYECEVRMKHKCGDWIWIKDIGSVESRNKEGKPIIMTGIHLDINEKKNAEIDLTKSSKRIESFISNLPGIAFRCKNDDNWTMEFLSQETKNITGYSPIEIIDNRSLSFSDLIYVKDREHVRSSIESAFKKDENYEIEYRIKRKDNNIIWVLERGNRIGHSGKYSVIEGIILDISQRKLFEEKLIKSEVRFRNMFENHVAIKLLIDPETGNIIDANKQASAFYGWSNSELKNMNIAAINTLPSNKIDERLQRVATNSQNNFEFKHRVKSGSIRDVNVYSGKVMDGEKEFIYSIIFDITDKKSMENRLMLLSEAVEQNPISVFITDSQGIITYVNKAFSQLTQFTELEIIGKRPNIFKSGKQDDTFYKKLWDRINKGDIFSETIFNKKKNGEIYPVRIIISPIKNLEGEVANFVALQQDLSELIIAKEKAEESNRLKSAFLATMNHELRTPLNHILGFSEMIPDMTDDESIKELSKFIYESGSNLFSIIEDIFDLAMMEQSEVLERKEHFYLRDIYIELKNQLKELLNESNKNEAIELGFFIDSKIATSQIYSDKSKILIVGSNILRNAIKFTHQGKISLNFDIIGQNELQISVSDTGIGIAKEKLEIIFEFFRQVDDSHTRIYEGVGIGLAISQKIAIALNGIIEIKSEVEKGSTFSFTLPVTFNYTNEKELQRKEHEDLSSSIIDLNGKTILLAEDDETSALLAEKMLSKTNSEIIKASNGEECLKIFNDNPNIDLILMDIKMPIMDGLRATIEIRKANNAIPIIALTAHSLVKDQEKALNAGCTDVITKPINKSILIKKLSTYLA